MSGPKTSHYKLRANRQQENVRKQAEDRKRREALAARLADANETCSALEKRTARLAGAVMDLRSSFPMETVNVVVPEFAVPQTEDPQRLENYVTKIEGELAKAESALRRAGEQAKANKDFRSATQSVAELCSGSAMSAEDVMQRFSEATKTKLSNKLVLERRAELDRILGRYASKGWSAVSPTMEHLVIEALSAETESRFTGLATEIRLQVQEMKAAAALAKVDAKKAQALLKMLNQAVSAGEDHLKQRLEFVRAGAIALPEGIEILVNTAIAKEKNASRRKEQETASGIVRDSLADLGYEVAPIEETLFVSGGKVYFRKAGWNDYCVRLTVRPEESKINFNVVKVSEQTDSADRSSRAADLEAENAWCSGYQQLVDTLKARGLETELTRHLPVGAVPVPVVASNEISLASFGAPTPKRKAAPKLKALKGNVK